MVVGELTQETDLLVIGGGPGGYSAAFRAAKLGVQTTLPVRDTQQRKLVLLRQRDRWLRRGAWSLQREAELPGE